MLVPNSFFMGGLLVVAVSLSLVDAQAPAPCSTLDRPECRDRKSDCEWVKREKSCFSLRKESARNEEEGRLDGLENSMNELIVTILIPQLNALEATTKSLQEQLTTQVDDLNERLDALESSTTMGVALVSDSRTKVGFLYEARDTQSSFDDLIAEIDEQLRSEAHGHLTDTPAIHAFFDEPLGTHVVVSDDESLEAAFIAAGEWSIELVLQVTFATADPTNAPTTLSPTMAPSTLPTTSPTSHPTAAPITSTPTGTPTTGTPTTSSTPLPSEAPTTLPSMAPTSPPKLVPTKLPSTSPSPLPTPSPTEFPSRNPTPMPTPRPTPMPTPRPTPRPAPRPTSTISVMGGPGFLQLGNWRFGITADGDHFSFCHRDGSSRTAMIFRSDGTQHQGPRNDYCNWDRAGGTIKNVYFGDRFIEFHAPNNQGQGVWRLGEVDDTHAAISFIPNAKTANPVAMIWREDGTRHPGPRSTRSPFDNSNYSSNVKWGHGFIELGAWRFGEIDSQHFYIWDQTIGKVAIMYTRAGTAHPYEGKMNYRSGQHIQGSMSNSHLPRAVNVKGGYRFIELGLWRIGNVDGSHFSFCHKDGEDGKRTAAIFTKNGVFAGGPRNDYCNWDKPYGFNQMPNNVYFGDNWIQFGTDWRLGSTHEHHLSIAHKDGKTAMIWVSNGTRAYGPRTDYNPWDSPATGRKNIKFGDNFLEIYNFRIAEINDKHISIGSKITGKTSVIYRHDGTVHAGPRDDYSAKTWSVEGTCRWDGC